MDIGVKKKIEEIAQKAINETTRSQLPGRGDGPADAYRHMIFSAYLHKEFGRTMAEGILLSKEVQDLGIDGEGIGRSVMDNHNNQLGLKIGDLNSERNISDEEINRITMQTFQNAVGDGSDGGPKWMGKTEDWQDSNPTYDPNPKNPNQVKGRMPTEHTNWPNPDFDNPYRNNPFAVESQKKEGRLQPTLNEELRTQFREDESKRNQSDPNAPTVDEVDPKTGKKFGDMRTGEYASALFRKRQREAANGNATNDNAPSGGGDVQVRAHDREGGKEHVNAYTRSKPKK